MRHHQQYHRKQHSNKFNSHDYETSPTGGDDEQVRHLFHGPQVKKSDIRSCHPHARSCNLEKILQESDTKSSPQKSCIRSYYIFFQDLTSILFSLQTCGDILRTY